MTDFTYRVPASVADTTDVGAYPASAWVGRPPTGAARGTATDTQTVASGEVTFTGLTDGVQYYVIPDGESIIGSFMAGEDTPGHVEPISSIEGLQTALDSKLTSDQTVTAGDTLGTLTGALEVYDADGNSLGFVATYDGITTA